jgi:hypothetical protein
MNKDDLIYQNFEMSIQAFALARAIKRMLVSAEKQDEFLNNYKSSLKEVISELLSRNPELDLPESFLGELEKF